MYSRSAELPQDFIDAPLAHRGLHDRGAGIIENSLSAIEAAVAEGYGIEIDIQAASCGEAMVFHDGTLDRLTGETGPVNGRTAEELREIVLTDSTDAIPTLKETLEIVRGKVPLLLEIKEPGHSLSPDVGALEERVADLLRLYAGPVAVMSFNPHSVTAFGRFGLAVARGLVTCDFQDAEWDLPEQRRQTLANIEGFDRSGSVFISHDARSLNTAAVERIRRKGFPVLCWTVRSQEQEDAVREIADNITFEGYRPKIPEPTPLF